MGREPSAGDRISRWLLRWRWLTMLLLGLIVTAMELLEHKPLAWAATDRDFLREVAGLGILIPVIVGSCLTAVERLRSEVK